MVVENESVKGEYGVSRAMKYIMLLALACRQVSLIREHRHRYMKQRHMQVLIRTSQHDILASHMVVCVFTVLVGTSHISFGNHLSILCVTVRLWGHINCIPEHYQIFC